MEYRLVEGFSVTGKTMTVSTTNGENFRRIPQFWRTSYADGTVDSLRALRPDGLLTGICLADALPGEQLTYVIGVEGAHHGPAEWTTIAIPASTWAIFPSTGALPDAIQRVWTRIFEEWFPATGYQHAGGPEVEVLPPRDDVLATYQSQVWVPVVRP